MFSLKRICIRSKMSGLNELSSQPLAIQQRSLASFGMILCSRIRCETNHPCSDAFQVVDGYDWGRS